MNFRLKIRRQRHEPRRRPVIAAAAAAKIPGQEDNLSNYKETLLETITTWPPHVQLSRVGTEGALEKVLDNVVEDGIGWSARRAQVSGTQALVLHPGKCPGILRPHAP